MASSSSKPADHIHFEHGDEEAGQTGGARARPELRSVDSSGSLSIRPHPRRTSIDAAAELPIQYRTLSIDVDDYAQKRDGAGKKNKPAVTGEKERDAERGRRLTD